MDKFPLQINKKFRFCQHKKSVESDASFRWANNNRKRVLNVRLVYANKTREPISYHKRGSHNFLAKYQQCWKQKPCAKATLLPKLLTENPNLGDSGGFQPDFPFRTEASSPECTLIVVVKDFRPEDFLSFHTY